MQFKRLEELRIDHDKTQQEIRIISAVSARSAAAMKRERA